jgi:hypothetical protein
MALTAEERKRQEAARKRAQEQDRRAAEARRKQAALEKDQKARRDQILSDARTREERTRITANKSSRKAEVEQARRRGEVADIHGGGEAARRRMEAEIKSIRAKYRQGVKPATKPQSLTQRDKRIGNTDVNALREAQNKAIRSYNGNKPTPAKPSETTPAKQARTGGSNNTVSRAATGKPVPKPAGKVPSSNETYRDGGKGLYQGSKEYRDKVGGSGNPLLNRFRKDMGRNTDTGAKTDGVGPVSSGSDYAKSKGVSKAQSDANKARVKQGPPAPKKESLKERMERMKKRRQGTAWGGVD